MTINTKVDILTIFISIILGGLLSLIYDFIKAIRISFKCSKLTVFIEDIIFSITSSILVFLLLLVRVKGEIRLFVFIFLFIGFFVSKKLLSKNASSVMAKTLMFIRKKIIYPAILFSKSLTLKLNETIDNFFKKYQKSS